MQSYQIEIKPSVTIRLNSLTQPERAEVMSDIERLAADPFPPGAPNTYLAEGSLDGESGQVVGRSAFLPQRERHRLNWRLDRVLIKSNKVSCLTFDDLYLDMRDQLASLALLAK